MQTLFAICSHLQGNRCEESYYNHELGAIRVLPSAQYFIVWV